MNRLLLRMVFLLLASCNVMAVIETYDFPNDDLRHRYELLSEELRCPKCQNQNLSGSDSQIAADLRRELHRMLLEGKSDEAIVDFMRDRYGDFVLYKPRLQNNTLLLWLAPPALALIVLLLLWWSRRAVPETEMTSVVEVSGNAGDERESLSPRVQLTLSLLVVAGIAGGSLLLYRQLGAWQSLEITDQASALLSGTLDLAQAAGQRQVLLVELDALLASHPDNEKMRYLRARLLAETQQWQRAGEDFRWLLERFADQDNLLAEYGQVLFMQNGNVLTVEAADLLKRALQFNPDNSTALGLLGMQAFEAHDYKGAVRHWNRLLAGLPSDSRNAEAIRAGIARARELGGSAVAEVEKSAALEMAKIAVHVAVAADVAVDPSSTVFVLLHAQEGPRMPLAAVKTSVAQLQADQGHVVLDMASSPMRGRMDFSAVKAVEVVARISKNGMPQAAAGDWQGVSAALDLHALPLSIDVVIDHQVSAAGSD